MWDFDIGRAVPLMGRSLPFILLRIAVYAGIAIAHVRQWQCRATVRHLSGAFGCRDCSLIEDGIDPAPLKWSDLRHVF
jgi:hypothetical protein